jgi:hypothetical protein
METAEEKKKRQRSQRAEQSSDQRIVIVEIGMKTSMMLIASEISGRSYRKISIGSF